jgi:hypothetical protein
MKYSCEALLPIFNGYNEPVIGRQRAENAEFCITIVAEGAAIL